MAVSTSFHLVISLSRSSRPSSSTLSMMLMCTLRRRLQKEGVVSRLTNGTLMIQPVTVEQLLEIVQIRRLLEGSAAARAAERPFTAALEQSRSVMRAYVDGKDVAFDHFWMDDDVFHEAVAEAAGLRIGDAVRLGTDWNAALLFDAAGRRLHDAVLARQPVHA